MEDSTWLDYSQGALGMLAMELPHTTSKFDLSFYFKSTPEGGFVVHIEYCTELLKPPLFPEWLSDLLVWLIVF